MLSPKPVKSPENRTRRAYLLSPFMCGAALLVAVFLVAPVHLAGISFLSLYVAAVNAAEPRAGGENPAGDPLTAAEGSRLQPGDIILRRGSGPFSSVIVNLLDESTGFSHSGVVVLSPEGEWQVVHSISSSVSRGGRDGVQVQSLEQFTKDSVIGTTVVTRLKAERGIRSGIAGEAFRYLQEGNSFDMQFRRGPETGIYCSELISLVLPEHVRSQVIVDPGPRNIVRFESFLDARWFKVVVDLRQ